MTTYETAQLKYITLNSTPHAYIRFGRSTGTPLFLHTHYRATLSHWDPALLNPLAATRPILLLDSSGVGHSQGTIPTTFTQWAQIVLDFFAALSLTEVDVLGFSMGGCAAQMVALNAPRGLVRKLVLAGTMPSAGEGVVGAADLGPFLLIQEAETEEEQREGFLKSFFGPSERSQGAGRESFERIRGARKEREEYVGREGAARQGEAYGNFMDTGRAGEGSYERLGELTMPVLIANGEFEGLMWWKSTDERLLGDDDLLMPTVNSIVMYQKLQKANAQLHLYPDSGHGFLYQYAAQFAKLVNDFLDDATLAPAADHE